MNIFQRIGRGLLAFFTSPEARSVEKELAVAAVPVAEQMLAHAVGASPVGAVAVPIVESVVAEEAAKSEAHRPSSAP